MKHLLRAPTEALDFWAARRLLQRLFEQVDGVKTDDELTVEAWLWRILDEPGMAERLEECRGQ